MSSFSRILLIIGGLFLVFGKSIDLPNVVPVDPPPIEREGLHVLIVEETEDRRNLPSEQLAALRSNKLYQWLDNNTTDLNGEPAWRILDDDADLSNADPVWQKAMKREREELPWIIISDAPKGGTEQPFPENLDKTLELLQDWK